MSSERGEIKKIGFIGVGNMAAAIISGALANGYGLENILGCDVYLEKIDALGIEKRISAAQLVADSDIIFLAVKPDNLDPLLEEIAGASAGKAFVSIVTGKKTQHIQKLLPGARVMRLVPNTPLLVGEGAMVISDETTFRNEEINYIEAFLGRLGTLCRLPEKLMDAATGLIGSGPAYVFVFIEALADASVKEGIPRDIAYRLAAQTVLGSGKMVLETGKPPALLKDAVTSPGGTTAAGLYAMEKGGFRAAAIDAVIEAIRRAHELSGS